MVRLPVKKTTRLLEGESRSKVVGCNNTSFLFANKQFKEKMKFFSFFFFSVPKIMYICNVFRKKHKT